MSARINAGITRGRVLTIAVLTTVSCLFAMTAMASAAEPVANDVFYGTNDVTPVTVTFNASDADNDPIVYSIVDPPSGGTLGSITGNQVTYTANANFAGTDSFTYRATANGQSADANATVTVKPQTVIDSGPNGLTNDSTPTWDFSSPQGGTTFECKVDGASFSACTSPYTASTLGDGSHTFQVRSRIGGVIDSSPSTRTINVDATTPQVAVVQDPGQVDPTNNSAIRFALLSDENISAATVTTSDFSATNGSVDSVENGNGPVFIVHVTAAADGAVTIAPSGTFSVSDLAGNAATTAGGVDRTVTYDSQVDVNITSAPVDGNLDGRPAIDFSSSEDPDVTYQCRLYENGQAGVTFAPAASVPTGAGAGAATVQNADVNGDGILDLISFETNPGDQVSVMLGTGSGTFGPPITFGSGGQAASAAVGDFNGDGNVDLVLAHYSASYWRLFLGNGDGTFTGGVSGPIGDAPRAPKAADMNGDGDLDLVFAAHTNNQVYVLAGNGDGTFAAPVAFNVGVSPIDLQLKDLNGDGEPDAVIANRDSSNVSVLFGTGTGSYFTGPAENYPTGGGQPGSLSIGDLNGDNRPDIVVQGGAIRVLLQNPNGTFAAPTVTGVDAVSLEMGDFDGDGNLDVAGTDPAGGGVVRVYRGNGTGSLGSYRSFAAPAAWGLTTGDFNADGLPDLASAAIGGSELSVLLNTSDNTPPSELPAYEDCTSPRQLPLLDKNVSYTFDVKVTDEVGNTNTDSAQWLQSNTAPAVPSPDETLEAGQSVAIDLGSTDADSDPLTYSIVGAVTGGTVSNFDTDDGTLTFTADNTASGVHTINFSVTDNRQGGTTSGAATVNIQPQTQIDTRPPAETNDQTPTWTFSSASGRTTFECQIDGGSWDNCDGGSFTPATDLAEGSHDFAVRTTDGALADPTPDTDSVIVDITTPDISITSTPDALGNDATPAFEFNSTDGTATLTCSVDPAGAPGPVTYDPCASNDTFGPLTDGHYVFSVRSTDPGGNVSAPATFDFEIDVTLPVIALGDNPVGVSNGPAEGKQTNAKKPIYYFTTTDTNLDDSTTTCWFDGQTPLNPCVSPFQSPVNLNDGAHALHITTEDSAGNLRTFDINFTVDTLAPSAFFTDTPGSPSGPSAHFEFSASTALGAEGKFECRTSLNGGAAGPWSTCASPLDYTNLSSGTRKLEVRAVDSAGNASSGAGIASHTWTTIGGAPDTVISQSNKNGGTAAFGFNSPGNPLATFECKIDAGAFGACTSPKTYSSLSVGSHTFSVRATNQVGTVDPSPATNTWTVSAPVAPDTDITRKPSATTTATAATLEFASTDGLATFECSLDDGPFTACTSPKSYSGLALGDHTLKVRAVSAGLLDTSPASAAWTVKAPVVDPPKEEVCNDIAENPVVTSSARISKGLLASATISHRSARPNQLVSVTLNGNGKKLKSLAKKLKNVTVISGGQVIATLRGKSWASTFTVTESQVSDLTLKFVRKKGKAIKKPAAFTVQPACDQ